MKVSIKDLLSAGVHFGHKSERWNPKMRKYIFDERNGIHIIDLIKTLEQLKLAHEKISEIVSKGGTVLFVGTKKQARDIIKQEAEQCGAFYVHERWLGGLLTNFKTVRKTLIKLKEDEKIFEKNGYDYLTKKELMQKKRQFHKKSKTLAGIKDMQRVPDILYVIDTKKHSIAIHEANLLDIPVIAITDTNADPDMIDIPIPGNDDAIKSITIITKVISNAVETGKMMAKEKQHAKKENENQSNENDE